MMCSNRQRKKSEPKLCNIDGILEHITTHACAYASYLLDQSHPSKHYAIPKNERTFRTGIAGCDEGDEGGPSGCLGGGEGFLDSTADATLHGGHVWAHDCYCGVIVLLVVVLGGVSETIREVCRWTFAVGGSQRKDGRRSSHRRVASRR